MRKKGKNNVGISPRVPSTLSLTILGLSNTMHICFLVFLLLAGQNGQFVSEDHSRQNVTNLFIYTQKKESDRWAKNRKHIFLEV